MDIEDLGSYDPEYFVPSWVDGTDWNNVYWRDKLGNVIDISEIDQNYAVNLYCFITRNLKAGMGLYVSYDVYR